MGYHANADGTDVKMTFTLAEGACSRSFGGAVARRAGLPSTIVNRAAEMSTRYERQCVEAHNRSIVRLRVVCVTVKLCGSLSLSCCCFVLHAQRRAARIGISEARASRQRQEPRCALGSEVDIRARRPAHLDICHPRRSSRFRGGCRRCTRGLGWTAHHHHGKRRRVITSCTTRYRARSPRSRVMRMRKTARNRSPIGCL